uniref:Uncharacterized protein n=1 Tax=Tanacetum cinerariifolium TaxID=118510 RepID=A0A6L2M6L2_TANCI|nr:hypothetical protein [Tanacetum cinerariifolium]
MLSTGGGGRAANCQTSRIFSDLTLSLLNVATPDLVGNFIMPWAVDSTAHRVRILGLPRILLYYEGDLTTKKFIQTVDWYGYFPKDTRRRIFPRVQMISPENPTNGTTADGNSFILWCCVWLFSCLAGAYLVTTLFDFFGQYLLLFLDFWAPDIGGRVIKLSLVKRSMKASIDSLLFASHDATLSGLCSSNHNRANPSKVALNVWHQVGITHLSTLAAVVKVFRWSSGSPVPSYDLTVEGILILFGKTNLLILWLKGAVDSSSYGSDKGSSLESSHSRLRYLFRFPVDAHFNRWENTLADRENACDMDLLPVLFLRP